jgi:basic membrane lipoprotein Med (substrate-binding protein (PBP1-ABC) superfamily)
MLRLAVIGAVVLVLAGCGDSSHKAQRTVAKHTSTVRASFDVRVVGPLDVSVPGVRVTRGSLAARDGEPLVVVSAGSVAPAAVSAAAANDPTTHFALVGASTKGLKQPNLVGIVFRDDQSARLGGILAGLVAAGGGGSQSSVAWVGPGERPVVQAFKRGVRFADPAAKVLVTSSPPSPARCKEAALTAFIAGATAVMSTGGLCGAAVESAAAEQNGVAASLSDFELPDVAVASVVRSALGGTYAGGEDLVFGFASGAIGVRHLDPRVPTDVAVEVRRAAQHLASGAPVTFD